MSAGLVELLELFEYKVEDVAKGQEPKGGWPSLLRLRQDLLKSQLNPGLAKRFRSFDQRLKDLRSGAQQAEAGLEPPQAPIPENSISPTPIPPAPAAPSAKSEWGILIEEDSVPTHSAEQEVLKHLSDGVYWLRLTRDLNRATKAFNTGKREELRVVYATLQNLEHYSGQPYFATDLNLAKFQVTQQIPSLSDPLVHFDEHAGAKQLLLDLFRQAYLLPERLRLAQSETVPYVRRFIRRIVDSYGIRQAAGLKGPSSEVLKKALEDALKSGVASTQVRDLEDRLRNTANEERRASLVLDQDRKQFSQAVERICVLLSRYLPTPRGEAALPALTPKILGGQEAAYTIRQVPLEAREITVRLMPLRLRLGFAEIVLTQTDGEYLISVEGGDYPMNQPLNIPTLHAELWVVRYGDYVHMRLEDRQGNQMPMLLSEGKALAYLLWPQNHYGYLRLLRAFSSRLKGPIEYAEFGPESSTRFAEAPPDALHDFARKGLEVVRGRIGKSTEWGEVLREAAQHLGLDNLVTPLQAALYNWINQQAPQTGTTTIDSNSTTITDSPIAIKFGTTMLSVRLSGDAIYVSNADLGIRRLSDLLVWPTNEGAIILAKDGARVAHSFVEFRRATSF